MTGLQIVTTPTLDWLAEQAMDCSSRMLVGSPYVNDGIIKLTDMVSKAVSRVLITRTDLRDFATRSSSLDTLCTLARDGVAIYSLRHLHAKMYVFDNSSALVTSANATNSGMRRNLECGLSTNDRSLVENLAKSLMSGLGADQPPTKVKPNELENLQGAVEAIKVALPKPLDIASGGDEPPSSEMTYSISDTEMLVKGFTGWRRLTLEGVLAMPESGFRMEDLLKVCGPMAARKYPKNNFVDAKLRQQLQLLRNVGIVDFVRPGYYRRTMNRTQG